MAKKHRGFSLLEIMIVVVILGIIAAMVIPRVLHQTQKAKETEAVQSLGAIRSAELTLQDIAGQFVAAADEAGIRAALGLTVGGGFYQYKVINATPENFLAVATPLDFLDNWLKEIAMDKNGFVGYSPIGGEFFFGERFERRIFRRRILGGRFRWRVIRQFGQRGFGIFLRRGRDRDVDRLVRPHLHDPDGSGPRGHQFCRADRPAIDRERRLACP